MKVENNIHLGAEFVIVSDYGYKVCNWGMETHDEVIQNKDEYDVGFWRIKYKQSINKSSKL